MTITERKVAITGLGVVSPIGSGKNNYWRALEAGTNGVGPITAFDASEFPVRIAAEVKDFNPEDYMPRKEAKRADRAIQFAVAASQMAMDDAGLAAGSVDPYRFGVYIGSGQGGISTCFENFQTLITAGHRRVSPFFIPMMITNMAAAYVAIQQKAKGPCFCVVTACATGVNNIGEAARAISRGDADVMLAGGTEAAVCSICVAGFAAMKALSTRNDEPGRASRPFDRDRDGFVVGEGAGVLVLEDMERARARGAHIYGEIRGYGSSCDASHITAPDPNGEGAARAMQMAVEEAGWDRVDLINAHGTSTGLNDVMESQAINRVFGAAAPDILVNSTKSMIGHGLGAAGGMETVAAIQSLEEGIIHRTLNLENQDPECNVTVVKETLRRPVDRVLVNSFGFGGHNAVIAIEKCRS
ncbi:MULTISPECIES: beta-ketoacyl-ACP synthase II [Jonquetella]|uniref:3-oxoacyl-[acyl-carrier-protein] synthase 2 n=1 Tax=Jonquetella anthropi DSM 22815 TaxID=885272 RepID=H0UJJ2_9BACT|nr:MULTISPECIES: beta-ketoacyl-ACP synthase II [Jonquetella]EEX48843.1 beta-ketoacyl-acyl-carrier-protein synthase II [Jonquetella anthropi E3_33 E1]EHM12860.1 beta-ketoacyl-acyl-carrier-protein synthase II [Jonquetella anthropi DSM 22815]ERL24102.1 beta-ketoacyl-acyl-carrier-protein synthase II [Jonquetella sp. BV3C21]